MPHNKLSEAVDNIRNHIFPDDATPYRAGKILWIIRQYIKYAMLAAIHGYIVGPTRRGDFRLIVKKWDYVPWYLRKKLMFSQKAYAHEFKLVFDSDILRKHDYYFNPDNRWKKEVQKIIESDKVYDLIPET